MTVFIDASALIAIIAKEPDALTLAETLQSDPARLCSAVAAWEATAGLCRSYAVPYDTASAQVRLMLETLGIQLVTIGPKKLDFATAAYVRFGKGRHPARLNMGDCYRLRLCQVPQRQAAVQR